MRVLLDLGYLLATPLVFLRYRAGFLQRLGRVPRRAGDGPCIWVHAVSVGELRAALPLVEGLLRSFKGWDLWISTSTDTAQELALRSLPPQVTVFYYPLDYGWAVRRTLRRVRPSAVILLELELWPNFLLAAQEANIPVLVANGRISPKSYPNYLRLRALSRWLFGRVTAIAAQSEEYASRFESLGVPRERIDVLGNLKYDAAPSAEGENSTFEKLGWTDHSSPILMGGSTHPGEENVLLSIWSGLRQAIPGLKLIIAPRHIERAAEVEGLLKSSAGVPVVRWSTISGGSPAAYAHSGAPVLLVDVMGDLDRFYRLADVVFVGGSLVPRGGHNMLEPARLGKPVLFGPWISNFEEIARHLLTAQAAVQVEDQPGLETQIARLLSDPRARQELGERAREAAGALRGATARHVEWIQRKTASRS